MNHLSGIIEAPEKITGPMVLMWNVGVIGNQVLTVCILSRQRSQKRGISSFRFDAAGRGLSGIRSDISFDFDRAVADVIDTIEILREKFGVQEFILYGHCSSAVEAHVVASKRHDVVGLIMIDTYSYKLGDYHKNEFRRKYLDPRNYLRFVRKGIQDKNDELEADNFEGFYPPLDQLKRIWMPLFQEIYQFM